MIKTKEEFKYKISKQLNDDSSSIRTLLHYEHNDAQDKSRRYIKSASYYSKTFDTEVIIRQDEELDGKPIFNVEFNDRRCLDSIVLEKVLKSDKFHGNRFYENYILNKDEVVFQIGCFKVEVSDDFDFGYQWKEDMTFILDYDLTKGSFRFPNEVSYFLALLKSYRKNDEYYYLDCLFPVAELQRIEKHISESSASFETKCKFTAALYTVEDLSSDESSMLSIIEKLLPDTNQ